MAVRWNAKHQAELDRMFQSKEINVLDKPASVKKMNGIFHDLSVDVFRTHFNSTKKARKFLFFCQFLNIF